MIMVSKIKNSIIFSQIPSVTESDYPGFQPDTYILKKGSVHRHGGKELPCDVLCERDAAMQLRDGTTIYMDIFRPVKEGKYPVLIAWAPYGKRGHYLCYDLFEGRMGVKEEWEDGLNEFEGPNPSYWVNHGYVILHPDPRGIFGSEGDAYAWGTQEAEDEYDFIEWAGQQNWSNGKVGMTGNSWLSMAQWNVASHQPPHLTAIAPWEGALDNYRDTSCKGGIPDILFVSSIFEHLYGNNKYENLVAMIKSHPLMDAYWEDKIVHAEKITIPAYVTASYTNMLHTNGTFAGWEKISSKEKWLRVHDTHEWHDYYTPEHVEDLRKFFDHYLKGVNNGWEKTPRVRLTVLDPGHKNIPNRPEESFPLHRQKLQTFYLDTSNMGLSQATPHEENSFIYNPQEGASFQLTFTEDVEIIGYMNLCLYVAAESADDMDLFAYVRKRDKDGKLMSIPIINRQNCTGASGRLRVSMRKLNKEKSTVNRPYYTFDEVQKLHSGEIVPVEIGFWPFGMKWHAGEKLDVFITGNELWTHPEFPNLPAIDNLNKGRHIIYTGSQFSSRLIAPIIKNC